MDTLLWSFVIRVFQIDCDGEKHCIGIDDDDSFVLYDHDSEQMDLDEALSEMGLDGSACYELVRSLEMCPDFVLHQAVEGRDVVRAEMAILAGADVRWLKDMPLRNAAMNGDVLMCALLIEAGADVNAQDNEALWFSVRSECMKTMLYLDEVDVEVNRLRTGFGVRA